MKKSVQPKLCVHAPVPLSGDQVQGLGQYTRINTAHFLKIKY